jgi:hypothetical protein
VQKGATTLNKTTHSTMLLSITIQMRQLKLMLNVVMLGFAIGSTILKVVMLSVDMYILLLLNKACYLNLT